MCLLWERRETSGLCRSGLDLLLEIEEGRRSEMFVEEQELCWRLGVDLETLGGEHVGRRFCWRLWLFFVVFVEEQELCWRSGLDLVRLEGEHKRSGVCWRLGLLFVVLAEEGEV